MILVDTSVWIDHLRKNDPHLRLLLFDGEVACHQLVVGELVCGTLQNRQEIIGLLQALPMTPHIDFDEYLYFVEKHSLHGRGIGYIDIHLLASAVLSQVRIWTLDKRLKATAAELDVNYKKSG